MPQYKEKLSIIEQSCFTNLLLPPTHNSRWIWRLTSPSSEEKSSWVPRTCSQLSCLGILGTREVKDERKWFIRSSRRERHSSDHFTDASRSPADCLSPWNCIWHLFLLRTAGYSINSPQVCRVGDNNSQKKQIHIYNNHDGLKYFTNKVNSLSLVSRICLSRQYPRYIPTIHYFFWSKMWDITHTVKSALAPGCICTRYLKDIF